MCACTPRLYSFCLTRSLSLYISCFVFHIQYTATSFISTRINFAHLLPILLAHSSLSKRQIEIFIWWQYWKKNSNDSFNAMDAFNAYFLTFPTANVLLERNFRKFTPCNQYCWLFFNQIQGNWANKRVSELCDTSKCSSDKMISFNPIQ